MKFIKQHWVILLSSICLIGLGAIQLNWIWKAKQGKQTEVNYIIKNLSPKIAIALNVAPAFKEYDIIKGKDSIPKQLVHQIVDSIMTAADLETDYHYAIYQEKEEGIFYSPDLDQKQALKDTEFKTCLSCIMTVQFIKDTINPKQPEMTFIRSVSEMQKLPGRKPVEEYLWFSLHVPDEKGLTSKAMLGLIALTGLLMACLISLFYHINQTLQKQKQLSQVKDDFFNNMTHEFKTPLSSIKLASNMLKKPLPPEKQQNYLNLISKESGKLETQVDRLLQLSLIDAKALSYSKEKIDLNLLIQEVKQRLDVLIDEKEAEVNLSLDLKDNIFEGDKFHLSNCFYNLLDNALKYAGEKPKILISTFKKEGKRMISFKDFGKGIPKEFRDSIFDRFSRAQKNDQYKGQGFGIGLSYVEAIVKAHRGKILLNEDFKNGTEFIIEL